MHANAIVLIPALAASVTIVGQAGAQSVQPPDATYALDPPHTFVLFAAQHLVVGMVRGRFDKVSGTLVVGKNPADCTVDVTIDAASLSTQNTMRDDDLRGPDFFDVVKNPTATYRGHGVRRVGQGWIVDGTLTIRGVSKVVPLTFTFNGIAPAEAGRPMRIAFRATAATRRADFDMTRDLLSEIGPKTKGPDVWLEIDAEALATAHP
jgi:Uncharacterized conserved protein